MPRIPRDDLTAEFVRSILAYDPETGLLRWKISATHGIHPGDVAGGADPNGRLRVRIKGRLYQASRLVWLWMTGEWPKGEVDHEDTNKANNRRSNLRDSTHAQNNMNVGIKSHNTTGFKGVSTTHTGRYRATICRHGVQTHLGSFDTPEQAHAAYCVKAAELHGGFARTE